MLKRNMTIVTIFSIIMFHSLPAWSQGFTPPRPDFRHFVLNQDALNEVARARGFISAQISSLELIARLHPELAGRSDRLQAAFEVEFNFPSHRTWWYLEDALGNERAAQTDTEMRQQIDSSGITLSRADAVLFLDEVEERIAGRMDDRVLRTLLWLGHATRPAAEIRTWWQTFESRGHPKAIGLDLTMRLPLSWRQQEGDRPHVVAKWTNQNGTGDMVILLLVRELPGRFSFEDMLEVERLGDWGWLLVEGFSFLGGRAIELDRQPGLQIDSIGERRALDINLVNRIRTYVIFPENRMIHLSCMLAHHPDSEEVISVARFEALKEACRSIAATVTFPGTYR